MGASHGKDTANIRKFTSETREAVTKLSRALVAVTGKDGDDITDMVTHIKDSIRKTEEEIERLGETRTDRPMTKKMRNLQTEELMHESHVQWVLVNAMWVVVASIAMASFMDDIVGTYHDAIDELVTFVTKRDVRDTRASIEKLLESMKRHQQKVEGALQEGMSKFPELSWDTPIFEAMKSPM